MNQIEWDELLGPLNEEERKVMHLRLGTDQGTIPRPIEDVADILKIKPSRVARIEDEAMQKLRDLEQNEPAS